MARTIELKVDPITRIAGHLGVRAVIDVDTRKPIPETVRSFITMFRGVEVFSVGRPPEDMPHVTSRLCGVCGSAHANGSVIAVDMAYGVTPLEFGVVLRNLAHAMTDHIYDHPHILNLLEGPDFSESIVSKLTPSVWEEAKKTMAEHRDIHGMTTVADIMRELNPVTGKMWQLAVLFQRIAREAGVLIYGRHSHPSTLIPGGISTDLTDAQSLLIAYTYRLTKLTAWVKFNYLVWEDLLRFYEDIGYALNGATYEKPNVMSAGLFDDAEAYSSIGDNKEWEDVYKGIDEATEKRTIVPGLMLDGELVSTKYTDMNVSTMEHVEHSFYDEWADKVRKQEWYTETDPLGNKLLWGHQDPAYHPWNKVTIPKPMAIDWNDKYTWGAHVRIVWKDGKVRPIEVGPYARMLILSVRPNRYSSGNGVVKVTLPRACTDEVPPTVCEEMTFEWKVPRRSSTIYRLWARAFNTLVDVDAAWLNVLKALELVRNGKIQTSRPWGHPGRVTRGAGFVEVPRGTVRHWLVQKGGKVLNYQIHAATTPNVSPFDKYGRSPYEESVANAPITEETPPDEWQGLDFVRAIRSFDPCLPCAAHLEFSRNGKVVKVLEKAIKDVTSCYL